MRAFAILLLLVLLACTTGCREKKKAVESDKPIVPTAREREVLAVHEIDPRSERGQAKLRKMRDRDEKLAAARERMEALAEKAAEREAEEEAAGD